jgi:hypothetical protein
MASKTLTRSFLPVLVIFIVASVLFIAGKATLTGWGINPTVLIVGNIILFVAALVSYYLFTRSMQSKNAAAIVRTIYGGVFSKMMICLIGVVVYVMIVGSDINKGGIIGCMFLYLIYSTLEVVILMKLSKQKTHV